MGRHGVGVPRVRRRRVRLAVTAAAVLGASALAHSEWEFSHRTADAGAVDPGIVMAAKVASVTTRNAILISVTAPTGQPAGVVYTVARVTGSSMTTLCTGPAPLRCTDPVRPGRQAVSYTVSSTLAGEGTATTTVDVTAPPQTVPTAATEPARRRPAAEEAVRRPREDTSPSSTPTRTEVGSATTGPSPSASVSLLPEAVPSPLSSSAASLAGDLLTAASPAGARTTGPAGARTTGPAGARATGVGPSGTP